MSVRGQVSNLDHVTYICKYHIVWCTKYRGKFLASKHIKEELKGIIKSIMRWKGITLHQWHIGDEHIHLYIEIPPKYSGSYIVQIIKSKSSSWIRKKVKNFPRGPLWVRGYFMTTVGMNEEQIKQYIKNQDVQRIEPPKLPLYDRPA